MRIALAGCSLFLSQAFAACVVKDDANQVIQLAHPAKRIVSLAPAVTETLFAMGAGQHVVGVISGSDYPAAARHLPRVGSYSGIDLERLSSLQPDLIIVWGQAFSRPLARLKKKGVAVYISEPKRLEDIPNTIKRLGCLTGEDKKAEQVATQYTRHMQALKARYGGEKPLRVFYQIGSYSLITINADSWINEALALCGGRNIFADAKTLTPEVSWEEVIRRDPEVIMSGEADKQWKKRWEKWPTLSAVKHQRLFALESDLIHRPGPRLAQGVDEICQIFHIIRKEKA